MGTFDNRRNSEMFNYHPLYFLGHSFCVLVTHLQAESYLNSKLTCNYIKTSFFCFYALMLPNREGMESIQKRLVTITVK